MEDGLQSIELDDQCTIHSDVMRGTVSWEMSCLVAMREKVPWKFVGSYGEGTLSVFEYSSEEYYHLRFEGTAQGKQLLEAIEAKDIPRPLVWQLGPTWLFSPRAAYGNLQVKGHVLRFHCTDQPVNEKHTQMDIHGVLEVYPDDTFIGVVRINPGGRMSLVYVSKQREFIVSLVLEQLKANNNKKK